MTTLKPLVTPAAWYLVRAVVALFVMEYAWAHGTANAYDIALFTLAILFTVPPFILSAYHLSFTNHHAVTVPAHNFAKTWDEETWEKGGTWEEDDLDDAEPKENGAAVAVPASEPPTPPARQDMTYNRSLEFTFFS